MAFCPGCGSQVAENASVCPSCGKTLAQPGAAGTATVPAQTPAPPSASGLTDNLAAALAYLVVPGIIFLFVEPYNRNRFVKFHALQGIGLFLFWIVGGAILGAIPFIGWFVLGPLFTVGLGITAIVCAIKAYQNQWFKLPGIGGLAEKQANS